MRISHALPVLTLAVTMSGAPASADMSAEEISALFQKQIEAQNQPLTRSITGLNGSLESRGLSIVTVDDVVAEAVDTSDDGNASMANQSGSTTVTQNSDSSTLQPLSALAATGPDKPVVYAKYNPEMQVNLQIKFGFDSAVLDVSEKAKLTTMCSAMKSTEAAQFRIIGHTDASGSDDYNEKLSVLRAKEVARHLVQECGIPATRLQTIGMGERFPINETDQRSDENRRVEFQAIS